MKQELDESHEALLFQTDLNGQMLEDWFDQALEACLYGMRQAGRVEEQFPAEMEESFWSCGDAQSVLQALREGVSRQIGQRYIQQHYQEALRLEDVSSAAGFNATYFSTLFKKETGQNFMDYLTDLRIGKAKELLSGDGLSVQDVAEMVGYRDLKYFSKLFKKVTGVSPSDYKKLYR